MSKRQKAVRVLGEITILILGGLLSAGLGKALYLVTKNHANKKR